MASATTCSPGGHTNRRNFQIDDYLRMCSDGEAEFSIAEAARLMGVSRMYLHRIMSFSSVPPDEFEVILDRLWEKGRPPTTTAIADEIKRRTGRVRTYTETCPACGHVLRQRQR